MPSYAFAIGNVRMYLRIGPKTRTNRRFSKTRPDKGQKEDVSGETRTYGNPKKGKTSLDLNEARDDGVWRYSGISWTICEQSVISLQIDNHTNTSLLNFYRPDALPGAQAIVSKY